MQSVSSFLSKNMLLPVSSWWDLKKTKTTYTCIRPLFCGDTSVLSTFEHQKEKREGRTNCAFLSAMINHANEWFPSLWGIENDWISSNRNPHRAIFHFFGFGATCENLWRKFMDVSEKINRQADIVQSIFWFQNLPPEDSVMHIRHHYSTNFRARIQLPICYKSEVIEVGVVVFTSTGNYKRLT